MPKGIKGFQKGIKTGIVPRSAFKKGHIPWNKDKHIKFNDALEKWRENGGTPWNKGKENKWGYHTIETRKKLSKLAKERILAGTHNFIDLGVISENKKDRMSSKFRIWREGVFKRDDWTCQKCNIRGGILHPHHILNFLDYEELRYDVTNGVTFCKKCHGKFHKTYGTRKNNDLQRKEFLND